MIRGTLMVLAAVAALAAGVGDARASAGREEVQRIVVQEALRSRHVPPSLALAVAEAESDFDPDAESPAGARGVMQIMPATGRGEFGVVPDQLWQPRLNVQLGIAFLDRLIDRYGQRWDLALSHYNGGSRVGTGAAARVIPATRSYVDKVLRLQRRNARDETVRQMAAAAEAAAPSARFTSARFTSARFTSARSASTRFASADDPAVERLPSVAWKAARLAALEGEVGQERPDQRRRRFLAIAESALDGADSRDRQRAAPSDSSGLLERIATRKDRFRALLATLRGG